MIINDNLIIMTYMCVVVFVSLDVFSLPSALLGRK